MRYKLALPALAFCLTNCSTAGSPDVRAVSNYSFNNPGVKTAWELHRQPRPGTIVMVFPSKTDTANATVLSSVISDKINISTAPAYSEHITIEQTSGITATLKFIGSFFPSLDSGANKTKHIELTTKNATAAVGPDRTPFLQTIFAMDGPGPKSPEQSSLFYTLKSQMMDDPAPAKGALYIVKSVTMSPDVTWTAKDGKDAHLKIAASDKMSKVADGSINGSIGANASDDAHYQGTPMVVSVVMKRIGFDNGVIRFNDASIAPQVVTGE